MIMIHDDCVLLCLLLGCRFAVSGPALRASDYVCLYNKHYMHMHIFELGQANYIYII